MKNIHILPTDKPSRLHFDDKLFLSTKHQLSSSINSIVEGRNINITSDEVIKGGDWVKNISFEEPIFKLDGKGLTYVTLLPHLKFKKVVLTTDQDLIKDGLQPIDDDFLEWFVKNPSCEELEVVIMNGGYDKPEHFPYQECYKIIIPKEEPKQETLEEACNRVFRFPKDISKVMAKRRAIELAKWQEQQTIEELFEWLTTQNYLTDLKETMIKDFNNFKNK